MGKIIKLIYRFQSWWNLNVPYQSWAVYTKDSYSSDAPRACLGIVKTQTEAEKIVIDLRSKHKGVLFFYEPTKVMKGDYEK